MKTQPFLLSIVFLIGIISCGTKEVKEEAVAEIEEIDITSISSEELSAMQGNPEGHYGLYIEEEGAITMDQFYDLIDNSSDTVEVKLVTTAKEVCKKKGCWMKVDLADGNLMRVTFKDYGFFVPLEIQNREVVLQGKAFKQTTSVEDLQHYAKDSGMNDEDIAAITETVISTVFIAEGVMMK